MQWIEQFSTCPWTSCLQVHALQSVSLGLKSWGTLVLCSETINHAWNRLEMAFRVTLIGEASSFCVWNGFASRNGYSSESTQVFSDLDVNGRQHWSYLVWSDKADHRRFRLEEPLDKPFRVLDVLQQPFLSNEKRKSTLPENGDCFAQNQTFPHSPTYMT